MIVGLVGERSDWRQIKLRGSVLIVVDHYYRRKSITAQFQIAIITLDTVKRPGRQESPDKLCERVDKFKRIRREFLQASDMISGGFVQFQVSTFSG